MASEIKITTSTLLVLIVSLIVLYSMAAGKIIIGGPQQPIDFFHRIHAGEKHIACDFCHRTTTTAAFAGMPAVETCMRCHRVVIPHHPQIQILHSFWEKQEPIPWVRVNHLPGFVYFNHSAHITAGVKCEVCHGDVSHTDRLAQVAPLSMGWCLACHQAHKAPQDCWTCHR